MPKEKITNGFGKRLARLRKERGLSQQQLADKIDVSRRVIAYYEVESDNPPTSLVILLSNFFNVSADALLGLKGLKDNGDKPGLKLARRMKKIEALPPSQQKFILKAIDSHLKAIEK